MYLTNGKHKSYIYIHVYNLSGHTVNKLRKHPDQNVSTEAKRVYVKWKTYFKEKMEKPQIEVKCDQKAEDLRLMAKKLFSAALGVEVTDTRI